MVYQCKGAVANGRIAAFETRIAGQNMDTQNRALTNPCTTAALQKVSSNPTSVPFRILSFGDTPLESPVPVMWWRSVYASTNGFAFESLWMRWPLLRGKIHSISEDSNLDNPRYQEFDLPNSKK